jgi:hypothetical protein
MEDLKKYEGWSKTKIINAIRREFMTCRQKWIAIQRHVKRIEQPDGRKKSLVECQRCKQLVRREDAECHHLDPVGSLASTAPADIQAYQERMFCRASRLVPLCTSCHQHHHYN